MWKLYNKKAMQEMRSYVVGEDITNISISVEDRLEGCPQIGGMIARNTSNHNDQWYVNQKFFENNYEEVN